MKTLSEIIEEYRDHHKMHSMEGVSGVRKLEQLLSDMGYRDGNFLGSEVSIANFLSDNSGAIDALLEWIGEQDVDDWRENLESTLPEEEEEEEEED